MITAEEARKNLVPMDEVLNSYLTKVINPVICEASFKRTSTKFRLERTKKGWVFKDLSSGGSWGGYSFDREKFTSEASDALEKLGYKTEIEELHDLYLTYGYLVVSWGEE